MNENIVILFHYYLFFKYNEKILSQNFLAKLISIITQNSQTTIKKELVKKEEGIFKAVNRISNSPEYENLKNNLNINKNELKKAMDLFNIQLFIMEDNEFYGILKTLLNLFKINASNDIKNILEYIENYLSLNKINNLSNAEVLKEFLTPDEINDLENKKFEKANLITLKASYFNLKIYLKILFPEEHIDKLLKEYFQYLYETKEQNCLNSFFNAKFFSDITNDEKRNIRNIIKQKTKLKFKTLEKYLNGKYYGYNPLFLYAIYLYIDYLEMLKKELDIEENVVNEFIKSIIE